jgi:hypothetical protein
VLPHSGGSLDALIRVSENELGIASAEAKTLVEQIATANEDVAQKKRNVNLTAKTSG